MRLRELLKVVDEPTREVLERIISKAKDRKRAECSACGTPGPWSSFKPGDGRCDACAP